MAGFRGFMKTMAAGAAIVALGLSSQAALAGSKDADRARADAMAKCAEITVDEARLACFDAVTTALKAAKAPRGASADLARAEAERERAVLERMAAEQAREQALREAEVARQAAELARQEAALATQRAELERQQQAIGVAAEEVGRAAEARIAEAERLAREAAERAAKAEKVAKANRTERSVQRGGGSEFLGVRLPFGNRLPETTPALFGASDLPDDAVIKLVDGDLEEIYQGEELDEITATAVKFGKNNVGKAYVVLESGAIWRQKGSDRILAPRSGKPFTVRIRRGSLGSFLMRINGNGKAIRVERVK